MQFGAVSQWWVSANVCYGSQCYTNVLAAKLITVLLTKLFFDAWLNLGICYYASSM